MLNTSSVRRHSLGVNFEQLRHFTSNPEAYRLRGESLVYDFTKAAAVIFTYELHRRLLEAGRATQAIAVHPGFSRTKLFQAQRERSSVENCFWPFATVVFGMVGPASP